MNAKISLKQGLVWGFGKMEAACAHPPFSFSISGKKFSAESRYAHKTDIFAVFTAVFTLKKMCSHVSGVYAAIYALALENFENATFI